ncbi:protein FAM161B isoform X2 [Oncorhynchus kisutch]|uniref:protein FAM161B isoform X2 n=1 Tax=Oncorhynchus kisutch TaxID=8019 RepID=UPI0009A00B1F|nr:protein FAM161B isoform X2 [Oncorhynchus kisutch]
MLGSGGHTAARMQEQRNMADLQAFLEDGLSSELLLQHQLQEMKEAHKQQLQETERRQREGLEKRIQQNSMLSAGFGRKSSADRQLDEFFSSQARGPRKSSSMSELMSGRRSTSRKSPQLRQSGRFFTSSAAWASATTVSHRGPQHLQHQGPTETEQLQLSKEEKEEAECQRKFRAVPVPGHVFLPLYDEMTQVRQKERKEGHEQRRDFLLSMQKPFSFLERDEKKREKLMQMISTVAQSQKATNVRKPVPKAIKEHAVSEHLKEEELRRKVRIQLRAQETLRKSTAPIENQTHIENPESRTAQRTKKEVLAFLDQKPTFQPKTNSQVPDFDRLHKAFQRESLKRAERKNVTKCQPFHLRTSTLPSRPSRSSSEKEQEPIVSAILKRSNSFGGLTSLSTDTLPTYITDAARKRCMAIRKSVEQKESKEQESAEWMRRHRKRSQAMKKTVAVRAKVMDPHSSLKEVYHEKLKQHREADQQRTREYKKELQDIKARVTVRPYLFEQVSQKNAKADAERIYRDKLREAGLNEQFVKTKGEEFGTAPVFILDDNDDVDDQSVESDMEKRDGNVDVGEKIEEVEEESVKTRVE